MTEKQVKILNVAKYILENKASIKECSEHFGYSVSSIKKYINNSENLQSIDVELYNAVKDVQKEIEKSGQIKGGTIGKRDSSYSDYEAMEIAEYMISNSITIEEAAKHFNMPKSSLYDLIRKIDNRDVQNNLNLLFEENVNKKNAKGI